jgi:hypothetical protein
MTQAQIAELLGVVERTVLRRWHAGMLRVSRKLGGQFPG